MMIERENVRIFFSLSPFFFSSLSPSLSLSLCNERARVPTLIRSSTWRKKKEENYPKKRDGIFHQSIYRKYRNDRHLLIFMKLNWINRPKRFLVLYVQCIMSFQFSSSGKSRDVDKEKEKKKKSKAIGDSSTNEKKEKKTQ